MIRINLSPKKIEKKKENIRLQIWVFILTLTLILAGCFLAYNHQGSIVRNLDAVVAQKQDLLKNFNETKQELKKLKAKEADIKKKRSIIESLIARRDLPIRVLDELSKTLVPEKVWLSSASEKNFRMTLQGYAMDNQTIALYMKSLENSPIFYNIELVLSQQETIAQIKVQKFSISVQIKS